MVTGAIDGFSTRVGVMYTKCESGRDHTRHHIDDLKNKPIEAENNIIKLIDEIGMLRGQVCAAHVSTDPWATSSAANRATMPDSANNPPASLTHRAASTVAGTLDACQQSCGHGGLFGTSQHGGGSFGSSLQAGDVSSTCACQSAAPARSSNNTSIPFRNLEPNSGGNFNILQFTRVFVAKDVDTVEQYNGRGSLETWHRSTSIFMATRLPCIGQLLKWPEMPGDSSLQQMHQSGALMANRAILSHHVWGLLARNLTGDALDQFSSDDQSEGLEVWRLTVKHHVCRARVEIHSLLTAAINPARCQRHEAPEVACDWMPLSGATTTHSLRSLQKGCRRKCG